MIIALDTARRKIEIEENDVLTKLSARVAGPKDLGWLPADLAVDADGQHLWASTSWLRATAAPASNPDGWKTEFDAMIRYASHKGWVNADNGMVRVHIEPVRES